MRVTGKRIRQARKHVGVSQAAFGEMAGLDRREANVKMSQYEASVEPKYNFILKLAEAAQLPEFFFYIQDDEVAESLILAVSEGKDWIYSSSK